MRPADAPQAALIYRLSGDYNPLHADPAYAKKAGFKMPILHGRCTFSIAGHAILKTLCGYDPSRLVSMQGRFASPVYPGEMIRTEMWRDGNVGVVPLHRSSARGDCAQQWQCRDSLTSEVRR